MAGMKKPPFLSAATGFNRAGTPTAGVSAAGQAARLAELAAQFEDLLDQVWRCEREWELDDRIAYACRRRR